MLNFWSVRLGLLLRRLVMSPFIATTTVCVYLVVAVSGCALGGSPRVGVANPASVACVKAGGRLVIASTQQGEQGTCHLPSGEVCDEWVFYRQGMKC